jgi:hypothetical protein
MNRFQIFLSAGTILTLIFSCGRGAPDASSCNCGNLYSGEFSPSNIDYSADELNDGDKMRKDVDVFVELGRACAIKFGKLTDVEKELVEGSTSLSTMPKIDQAVANAKTECN